MPNITSWLEQRRDIGALFIRLFMGTFLIYMSQDNVFDRGRMLEFERFLRQVAFPMPLLSAHVSVYAQFACGIVDPSAMLAGALFLLFHGAGIPSIDAWRARRSLARVPTQSYASYKR